MLACTPTHRSAHPHHPFHPSTAHLLPAHPSPLRLLQAAFEPLCRLMKDILGDKVEKVGALVLDPL